MRRHWTAGVVAVAFAITLGALAFAFVDDSASSAAQVERTTAADSVPDTEGTAELTDRKTLPPLPPPEARRALVPERQRRTPIAPVADRLEAANVPATELRDPNDPSASGGDAFALMQSTLVNRGSALWIAEPNVASKGERMMVVWNHGAAFSSDSGQTFTFVNPRRPEFPVDQGDYCCDQVVQYIPSHDLWVWFIQYQSLPGSGRNIVRLALARGDQAFDDRSFGYYDFDSRDFPALGAGELELDYPNLNFTDRHLFLAINVYHVGRYYSTVVLRIPLEQFAAGEPLDYRYWLSPIGSGDFAAGIPDTMYFGQHVDTSTLRVLGWQDDADAPTTVDVSHSDYPYEGFVSPDYSCGREGAVVVEGGGDWCARLRDGMVTNDDRPTSGWAVGDEIGFAWNVPRSPSRGFRYPFIHVLRVDRRTMATKDEPIIWHPDYAFQFGAITPNGRGDLGGIALSGGGSRYQTCASLIRDSASAETWDARAVDTSDDDPDRSESGDFLGAAPSEPGSNTWVATCMTMHGGGSFRDVEVRLFRFGRAKDAEEG